MWIGHASLLVQMHGVTFLTDPVLSERCSFSQVCALPWFAARSGRCFASVSNTMRDQACTHLEQSLTRWSTTAMKSVAPPPR